jgi:catalase
MLQRLVLVDPVLAARVAVGLGMPRPDLATGTDPRVMVDTERGHTNPEAVDVSPALAMVTDTLHPVAGRIVQILAADGCDLAGIRTLQDELIAAGVTPHVVAPHKGAISGARRGDELTVDRSFLTACAAEADAVVVANGAQLAGVPAAVTYVQEAFRHHKTVGAWGSGSELLTQAGIDAAQPGVLVTDRANKRFARDFLAALARHRHWQRAGAHPTLALLDRQPPAPSRRTQKQSPTTGSQRKAPR